MNNSDLVQQLVFALKELNVHEVIVCAGARNIPIVEFLEKQNQKDQFNLTSFFEERSAAFYALGRVKTTGRPVVIITTSGTAAVETFPAVVEAYYQGLPLIVVTADRPKSYRGSGAPQAIEQKGLFHNYCEHAVDWDHQERDFRIRFHSNKPFHFNICFDEPLIDIPSKSAEKKIKIHFNEPVFQKSKLDFKKSNPLVILSELGLESRDLVFRFLKENNFNFVSEALSGLKNHPELQAQELNHLFYSLSNQESIRYCKENFDSIIRIGGVPTLRLWRDLEYDLKDLSVISFSERHFTGLARSSQLFPLKKLADFKVQKPSRLKLQKLNTAIGDLKAQLLQKFKNSEQNYFQTLSEVIGHDPLYLGNSLPIREWDEFSRVHQKKQIVYGNRGANGIDGQISTYLGWARDFKRSWCVVGDLTALYDLASLTMATAPQKTQKCIVIVNNSGGQIFSRLFKNQKYLNGHRLGFKNWAQMFGWNYCEIKTIAALKKIPKMGNLIVEIKINNKYSEQFLAQTKEQVQKILAMDRK